MTALFVPSDLDRELARFAPIEEAIAQLADQYMPLHIADVNDRTGAELVHRARMDIKGKRCSADKVRKEYKQEALDYGRMVDGVYKRIAAAIEPIESHLLNEEEAHEAAKEAIRNAARLKAEAEERARQEAEAARIKAEQEAEAARIKAAQEAENERLQIEREKLEAERKAMEAERAAEQARQKAEQDRIDAERRTVEAEQKRLADIAAAEQKRLADAETARLRKIEDDRIAAEAAERVRIETEQRIAREEEAARAKAAKKEAARLRAEALRPDHEKLLAVADAVAAITIPEVSVEATNVAEQIGELLASTEINIRAIVEKMVAHE